MDYHLHQQLQDIQEAPKPRAISISDRLSAVPNSTDRPGYTGSKQALNQMLLIMQHALYCLIAEHCHQPWRYSRPDAVDLCISRYPDYLTRR
jgi:hypothetical protein